MVRGGGRGHHWQCPMARLDRYQRALLSPFERWVDRQRMLDVIDALLVQIDQRVEDGDMQALVPTGPGRAERVLTEAVEAFSRFHTRPALAFEDWRVLVEPKLMLYYRNRLATAGLKAGREP